MKQPVIARLERGEQPPSLATLAKITAGTGIEFRLDVSHGTVTLSSGSLLTPKAPSTYGFATT